MNKSVTISKSEFIIQAKRYLLIRNGLILGNRDWDDFDYEILVRKAFPGSKIVDFTWFLEVFKDIYKLQINGARESDLFGLLGEISEQFRNYVDDVVNG
jgi:hypothetical protein